MSFMQIYWSASCRGCDCCSICRSRVLSCCCDEVIRSPSGVCKLYLFSLPQSFSEVASFCLFGELPRCLFLRGSSPLGPFSLQRCTSFSQKYRQLGDGARLARSPPYLHLGEMTASALLPSVLISQGMLHFPAHADPVMGLSETRRLFLGAQAPPHLKALKECFPGEKKAQKSKRKQASDGAPLSFRPCRTVK